MSETRLIPHLTFSFECDKYIHTDEVIKIIKFIQEQPLFRNLISTQFHNLDMDGDIEKLMDQIDPEGMLYNEYLRRIAVQHVHSIEQAVRDELNDQLMSNPVFGDELCPLK